VNLREALRLGDAPRLALVGSGGKTSALFALAQCFRGPVLLTTSTHLSVEQARRAQRQLLVDDPRQIWEHESQLLQPGSSLIRGAVGADNRVQAAGQAVLDELLAFARQHHLPLLVEADGSRQLPLKAPADHEPAIPGWAETVVVTLGLSALGQPLSADWVHRLERYAAAAGVPEGTIVTPEIVTRVACSPRGGLKGIPERARRVALLNQVDTPALEATAARMAGALLLQGYDAVVSGALRQERVHAVYEREAGIILAAGRSARFGAPKVLLDWHGKPFVRQTAEIALRAGLSPVIVVVGAYAAEVRTALADLPVQVVSNPDWADGQSTSLRMGLAAADGAGAAIFLLADQPHLPVTVVRELLDIHRRSLAAIVAPRVDGRRANPVLFDRVTFADLQAVSGDQGGRAVMERWPVTWLDSAERRLLVDIDTPEDYQRLLDGEG
jgi:molybdenum cofactor cytidylyltransferase